MSDYYQKYLKYKNKYIDLKNQLGGAEPETDNEPMNLNDYLFTRKKTFFNELFNIFTDESREEFLNHLKDFLNSLEYEHRIYDSENINKKFQNLYNAAKFEDYITLSKNNYNDNYKLRDNIYYLPKNGQITYKKSNDEITIIDDESIYNFEKVKKIKSLSDISYITDYDNKDLEFILKFNTEKNILWRNRKKIKEIKQEEMYNNERDLKEYKDKNEPKEKYYWVLGEESDEDFEKRKTDFKTDLENFKENLPKHDDKRIYEFEDDIKAIIIEITENDCNMKHKDSIKNLFESIDVKFKKFNELNKIYSENNFEKIIEEKIKYDDDNDVNNDNL